MEFNNDLLNTALDIIEQIEAIRRCLDNYYDFHPSIIQSLRQEMDKLSRLYIDAGCVSPPYSEGIMRDIATPGKRERTVFLITEMLYEQCRIMIKLIRQSQTEKERVVTRSF